MSGAHEPEFEFLCRLTRSRPDYERSRELARLDMDWTRVLALAERHGVRPRLFHALKGGVWPQGLHAHDAAIEAYRRGHLVRNLFATRELLNVAAAFEARGTSFATFKGVALSMQLHGDLSPREFNDIDIIIRAQDLGAAEDALLTCGYRAPPGGGREWRTAFLGYQRQYMFRKSTSNISIDLHWDFVQKGARFPVRAEDIWAARTPVMIAGRAIPTFGGETLALYLAGHGFKEGWKSLCWVCDFADFFEKSNIDWISLCRRSQPSTRRQILLGLALANRLLGLDLPEELLRETKGDARRNALVDTIVKRMSCTTDIDARRPPTASAIFETCETSIDRLWAAWRFIATRTTGDYRALPLPRPLWRLYHLIRPVRLAGKWFSRD